MKRLVIAGGTAAGMSAAARARRLDADLEITVLEKTGVVSLGLCGLPYYAEGRVEDWRSLAAYPAEYFRRERNLDVRLNTEVTEVHHARRQVRLSGGATLEYSTLIVATGARAEASRIEGAASAFGLNTLEQAQRLRRHLETAPAGRAVVVGAGYIGLEAAELLRARGWRVTVVHRGTDVLQRADPALTSRLRKHLERFGVELVSGTSVRSVEPGAAAGLACDLCVLATGLTPNNELAAQAGAELGVHGAIRVSDRMETSVPGLLAAGDCAEARHLVTGRPAWIPLGTTANKMGRVAGATAAGASERFPGVVGTSIVRVCGLGVALTGLSEQQARTEGFDAVSARIEAMDRARYFRGRKTEVTLVAERRSGRLLGGTVLGENGVEGRINVIATALVGRMTVDAFAQLDLAYAPPFAPVWDPVLVCAQQLAKSL